MMQFRMKPNQHKLCELFGNYNTWFTNSCLLGYFTCTTTFLNNKLLRIKQIEVINWDASYHRRYRLYNFVFWAMKSIGYIFKSCTENSFERFLHPQWTKQKTASPPCENLMWSEACNWLQVPQMLISHDSSFNVGGNSPICVFTKPDQLAHSFHPFTLAKSFIVPSSFTMTGACRCWVRVTMLKR